MFKFWEKRSSKFPNCDTPENLFQFSISFSILRRNLFPANTWMNCSKSMLIEKHSPTTTCQQHPNSLSTAILIDLQWEIFLILFLSLMLEIFHKYFERNGKSCCRLTFSTSSSLVKIISSISSCKLVKWGCQLIDWLYLLLILHPMWFLWQQVSSNRILWTASES